MMQSSDLCVVNGKAVFKANLWYKGSDLTGSLPGDAIAVYFRTIGGFI